MSKILNLYCYKMKNQLWFIYMRIKTLMLCGWLYNWNTDHYSIILKF